ncbi:MAG: zinc ribbon domain-containing protein [Planctomycetota bacterium]
MEAPLKGKFCQSCGKQLKKDEDFGTEKGGIPSADYCNACYLNGMFTEPYITMDKMIEKITDNMAKKMNMDRNQIKDLANTFIPKLKRWKKE